ncbi:MAG: hypothetical protein U0230_17330 [Polyangiales bacterium]
MDGSDQEMDRTAMARRKLLKAAVYGVPLVVSSFTVERVFAQCGGNPCLNPRRGCCTRNNCPGCVGRKTASCAPCTTTTPRCCQCP